MKISAIIPVKTFSKAKTRLQLPEDKKNELCKLMLDEVLRTVSSVIEDVVVVSKDEVALEMAKQYGAVQIRDDKESGVNNAVMLADNYLLEKDFDASIVIPQDVPFLEKHDIETLLKFRDSEKLVLVVPSRRFDGTNALVRRPVDIMKTHYDEDSYKIHLTTGRLHTQNTSLVLLSRIMLDIDSSDDISFALGQNSKPEFCEKIKKLLS